MNRPHGDYHRIERRIFAAHDRLQREHDLRCHDDRILRTLWRRAMSAETPNRDVHGIRIRHEVPRAVADLACRHRRVVMHCDRKVGTWKSLVELIANHRRRALHDLLGRLSDQHHRAVPSTLELREHAGGAEKRRHVNVVSARVHHVRVLTGVRHPGFFRHRKRVHVGANEQHWTIAVLHHRDDAVACRAGVLIFPDVIGDRVAECAQPRSDGRGCFFFLLRQLRRDVKRLVSLDQRGQLAIDH